MHQPEAIQGYDCSSEEARKLLKVRIHNLRKKIEAIPERPAHILNLCGFGYLFEQEDSTAQARPGHYFGAS